METKTYTEKDLAGMTPEEVTNVFTKMVKIEGQGVVRDKDGNIKYDDPSKAGSYGEK